MGNGDARGPGGDYFDLIEDFERTTQRLREAPAQWESAREKLASDASRGLAAYQGGDFEKAMVWHADKLYRIVNAASQLDDASFVFLTAVGAAFDAVTRQRGLRLAYIADNSAPEDRLLGIEAFFTCMGFVVASPELVALKLGQADGVGAAEAIGPRFEQYRQEAKSLAGRIFDAALEKSRHCLWLSGACDGDELRAVAKKLAGPYVGVFRNQAPVDGSQVQVFRSEGRSSELAL
jgi:hypothetical protein